MTHAELVAMTPDQLGAAAVGFLTVASVITVVCLVAWFFGRVYLVYMDFPYRTYEHKATCVFTGLFVMLGMLVIYVLFAQFIPSFVDVGNKVIGGGK